MWPPDLADMICPHRPLMTQVQYWAKTPQTDHVTMRPWRSWRLWLMRVVVLHTYTKFEVHRPCLLEDIAHNVCEHLWTWWSWTLTLKLVSKSHQRWGTFLPNLGMLGLWVLELLTDGEKQRLLPFPYGRGHNKFSCHRNHIHIKCQEDLPSCHIQILMFHSYTSF